MRPCSSLQRCSPCYSPSAGLRAGWPNGQSSWRTRSRRSPGRNRSIPACAAGTSSRSISADLPPATLAGSLDPAFVPHRLGRLVNAAVGAEDQEPVEAASEPAVVSDGHHGSVEEAEPMLESLSRLDVEVVG